MTTFPNSPRLLRGGLVLIEPLIGQVLRIVPLQYNPDSLRRTLQVQSTRGEGGDRLEATRLTGPPNETISLDAEIDATDQLEFPANNPITARLGIHPQLAALETIVYPSSLQLLANQLLALAGTIEIAPAEAPLTLFIWSIARVLPVRITEFSVTEEAFDATLNPIRARVSLGMRVLNVNDLGFFHPGGALFMIHLLAKEGFAALNAGAALGALGLARLP